MIRTGVAVVVLGALLCLYTATMPDTPPQAGANIGAGILALLSLSVLTVGMVLVAIGKSTRADAGHPARTRPTG